jgi:hypothetical protein
MISDELAQATNENLLELIMANMVATVIKQTVQPLGLTIVDSFPWKA